MAEKEKDATMVKPLREKDPQKAALKTQRLTENARARQQGWIDKINLDDTNFQGT